MNVKQFSTSSLYPLNLVHPFPDTKYKQSIPIPKTWRRFARSCCNSTNITTKHTTSWYYWYKVEDNKTSTGTRNKMDLTHTGGPTWREIGLSFKLMHIDSNEMKCSTWGIPSVRSVASTGCEAHIAPSDGSTNNHQVNSMLLGLYYHETSTKTYLSNIWKQPQRPSRIRFTTKTNNAAQHQKNQWLDNQSKLLRPGQRKSSIFASQQLIAWAHRGNPVEPSEATWLLSSSQCVCRNLQQ